jgi:L-rhamnonate dehydratase
MRITRVRVFELEGTLRSGLAVFEARHSFLQDAQEVTPHRSTFTEIETDAGISGLCCGGSVETRELGQLLIGEDPMRIEHLWEQLFQGRYIRFRHLHDVAILDLALWDLIGKERGEPVYRLLGGPCREAVPAYAAMLGFSPQPELAAERSLEQVAQGFQGLKWYLPPGATTSKEGMREGVALVEAVRDAVGDDVDIMIDLGLTRPHLNPVVNVIELARQLEPYRITWLEEPLHYDDVDAHRTLAQATTIPLAVGEHWYTRWQFKALLDSRVATVLQPDPFFAGGITEVRKILDLASAYGTTVVPHSNESCIQTLNLLFAQQPRVCPMAEWGIRLNHNTQYFFRDFYEPMEGCFQLPPGPGFGYELDSAKILTYHELG